MPLFASILATFMLFVFTFRFTPFSSFKVLTWLLPTIFHQPSFQVIFELIAILLFSFTKPNLIIFVFGQVVFLAQGLLHLSFFSLIKPFFFTLISPFIFLAFNAPSSTSIPFWFSHFTLQFFFVLFLNPISSFAFIFPFALIVLFLTFIFPLV